jgi:acyl-CoA synthetase (NDP forming)
MNSLFSPQTIAVVGASERNLHARFVIENLRGFPGAVYGVNPSRSEVAGLACVPSLVDLPQPADLAMLLVSRDRVQSVLEEARQVGTRAVIINTDGYADSPAPEGIAAQQELVRFAIEHDIAVVGPNSLGVISTLASSTVFGGRVGESLRPGGVSVISQSGGNCLGLIAGARERGIGIHSVVSTGNEAVLDVCDFLEHQLTDERVSCFCLYLETIRRPERFLEIALQAARVRKPIVVAKIGRTDAGRAAALAHTGALAGPDSIVQALFDRAAVIRADDLDDALNACIVFEQIDRVMWPKTTDMAAFCLGGGAVGLISDLAEPLGAKIPPLPVNVGADLASRLPAAVTIRNPIDVAGPYIEADPQLLPQFVSGCLGSGEFAVSVVCSMLGAELLGVIDGAVAAAESAAKPLLIVGISEGSLPAEADVRLAMNPGLGIIAGPRRFLRGLTAAARWDGASHAAARVRAVPAAGPELQIDAAANIWDALSAYGIAVARQQAVSGASDAASAAAAIGFPVVLKASGAAHKTELGLVQLGLRNEGDVAAAFEVLADRARLAGLDDPRWIVQEHVRGGVEMYLGVQNELDGYAPVVLVGTGGVTVELFKDTAARMTPIDGEDAAAMLERVLGTRLLTGFRGAAPLDRAALEQAIVALARLAVDHRESLRALDLNPVIVLPTGIRVVDALAVGF